MLTVRGAVDVLILANGAYTVPTKTSARVPTQLRWERTELALLQSLDIAVRAAAALRAQRGAGRRREAAQRARLRKTRKHNEPHEPRARTRCTMR